MKKVIYFLILILSACSKNNTVAPTPKVGDQYQGGTVFYILQSGDPSYVAGQTHGFIAAENDLTGTYVWVHGTDCPSSVPQTATATGLGDGALNTSIIVKACPGTNAASACNSLVLNGYDDWYLPNIEEMKKMVLNHLLLKNYNSSIGYWTSNNDPTDNYEYAYKSEGLISFGYNEALVTTNLSVRPIRKF